MRCPNCGRVAEGNIPFCGHCGEALDPKTRLIMNLDKATQEHQDSQAQPRRRSDDNDYEYTPPVRNQKKKRSAAPWIILLAAAAVILWLVLR